MRKVTSVLLSYAVLLLFGVFAATSARAQNNSKTLKTIQPTSDDAAAAASAVIVYSHAFLAKTDAGAALKSSQAFNPAKRAAGLAGRFSEGASFEGNDQLRFPGDLVNFFGGPTVSSAQSHGIFLLPNGSCLPLAPCWGDPLTFLDEFGESGLSHVTDQYVGQFGRNRYTLGDSFAIPYVPTPSTAPLTDLNLLGFIHAVAKATGQTGYNHVFHIFLPPGQDLCTPLLGIGCYSPDVPSTFAFCAFHNSVDFSDIGHVLFSVEPFQNVRGCQVRTGTPNGQLVDSTNSTLSHELIETITDPDGDAWFNLSDSGLLGEEIADECDMVVLKQVAPNRFAFFGDPSTFFVEGHVFATQPEYSNQDHACAIRP